jgi:hypothetical protein
MNLFQRLEAQLLIELPGLAVPGIGMRRAERLDLQQADVVSDQILLEGVDQSPADTTPVHGGIDRHQIDLGCGREVPGGQEHTDWLR